MFGQLRNSIKIVPIKPCRRKACVCFADLEKRMAEGGSIKKKDYKKYQHCYMSRRMFLL
jgi:hypothetical protein